MSTFAWFEDGVDHMLTNGLASATLKVMLLDNNYVFAKTQATVSAISADELTGGGYARVAMASIDVIAGQNARLSVVDADDVDFGTLTGHTLDAAVVFFELAAGDSASVPLYAEHGINLPTNGGQVQFKPDGSDGWGYVI